MSAAQCPPGREPGGFCIIHHQFPVDHHVWDALRIAARLLIAGRMLQIDRVEHNQVGCQAGPQQAAAQAADAARRGWG